MDIYNQIAFALVGFIGGVVSIPVGGSFLIVIPALIFLGLDGLQAAVLARIMLIATMGSASFRFYLTEKLDWPEIGKFLIGSIFGFALAAKVLTGIDPEIVTMIVPWVLLIGSILLIKDYQVKKAATKKLIRRLLPLIALVLGFYAGMGGGGNGNLIVILLAIAFGWQIKRSIINTRAIELVANIVAVFFYYLFSFLDNPDKSLSELPIYTGFELIIFFSAAVGGLLGAQLTLKSKPKWIKFAFLAMVALAAIKATFF
jgi:uncharacterized membrane protein YfcA